eukprot:9340406-Pyramimonas_sp.AAC.1
MHSPPNWAARRLVGQRRRGARAFAAPEFEQDTLGEVTSITRVAPRGIVVVGPPARRVPNDL